MTRFMAATALALVLVAFLAPAAQADADSATHYYLSLGDSLAAGSARGGDDGDYPEQLFEQLRKSDPKLEHVRQGCGGESSSSMRFGSQVPTVVLSCGTPRYYKNYLFPKGTQLAEATSFLEAHKGKVTLITIDIGANDLSRFDEQFNDITCLFEPQGCTAQLNSIQTNLAAILAELRGAAGPVVPIVGMTYYDVFAPLCIDDVDLLFVCNRVDAINQAIAGTYAQAGVPVADVAGAFDNDDLPSAAVKVCAWTKFCTTGFTDVHPNAIGHGVIADAFLDVLG